MKINDVSLNEKTSLWVDNVCSLFLRWLGGSLDIVHAFSRPLVGKGM